MFEKKNSARALKKYESFNAERYCKERMLTSVIITVKRVDYIKENTDAHLCYYHWII